MKIINVAEWKEYKIKDLFDIKKGKRLTKAAMTEGDIPFIGASAVNNGLTRYIGNNDLNFIHPANTITVTYNGSVGQAFYQDCSFWASDDVNVLYPKFKLNRQIALFIIPIIRSVGKNWEFKNKWTKELMEETFIKLPTKHNLPDYGYMENYISNLEKDCLKKMSVLENLF